MNDKEKLKILTEAIFKEYSCEYSNGEHHCLHCGNGDVMVTRKDWDEFRKSGLLLFINQILHVFGWAIVFDFETYDKETDDGIIKNVYPARVKFRGFNNDSVSKSYIKIMEYMDKNIKELLDETKDHSMCNKCDSTFNSKEQLETSILNLDKTVTGKQDTTMQDIVKEYSTSNKNEIAKEHFKRIYALAQEYNEEEFFYAINYEQYNLSSKADKPHFAEEVQKYLEDKK